MYMYFFIIVFRGIPGMARDHETKKFIIYSIYSWGCTFLLSVFTFYMQVFPNSLIPVRPEIGVDRCWFNSKYKTIKRILLQNLYA